MEPLQLCGTNRNLKPPMEHFCCLILRVSQSHHPSSCSKGADFGITQQPVMQMRCPWEATQKPLPVAFLVAISWLKKEQGARVPSSPVLGNSADLLWISPVETHPSKLAWHFDTVWARELVLSMLFWPLKPLKGTHQEGSSATA